MRHMLIDLDLEFTKNNRFYRMYFQKILMQFKYNIRETTNIEINILCFCLFQGTNNAANITFTFYLLIFLYYANKLI